jgi:hypothetical protein
MRRGALPRGVNKIKLSYRCFGMRQLFRHAAAVSACWSAPQALQRVVACGSGLWRVVAGCGGRKLLQRAEAGCIVRKQARAEARGLQQAEAGCSKRKPSGDGCDIHGDATVLSQCTAR